MAVPPSIRIRVSPAKVAINSDWAIAEKLTGAWLPCQESGALQCPAQSNYRLNADSGSDPIRDLGRTESEFNRPRPFVRAVSSSPGPLPTVAMSVFTPLLREEQTSIRDLRCSVYEYTA
jgi:hypothetical protein